MNDEDCSERFGTHSIFIGWCTTLEDFLAKMEEMGFKDGKFNTGEEETEEEGSEDESYSEKPILDQYSKDVDECFGVKPTE